MERIRFLQNLVRVGVAVLLVTGCQRVKDENELQARHPASELLHLQPDESAVELNDRLIALGPTAVPAVIKLFDSENDRARLNAAWVLGEIGDRRALPILMDKGLNDRDVSVREFSAQAIGSIGDPSAIRHLKEVASKDVEPGVREHARGAIENIRSQMRNLHK